MIAQYWDSSTKQDTGGDIHDSSSAIDTFFPHMLGGATTHISKHDEGNYI